MVFLILLVVIIAAVIYIKTTDDHGTKPQKNIALTLYSLEAIFKA